MECMCAHTGPWFIHSSKRVFGNGVRIHINSKGKNHFYRKAPRRVKLVTLRHTGQRAQHTTNWTIPARSARFKLWVPQPTASAEPTSAWGPQNHRHMKDWKKDRYNMKTNKTDFTVAGLLCKTKLSFNLIDLDAEKSLCSLAQLHT